jgi:hypothetical protein
MHGQDIGDPEDAGDRRSVADKIEVELVLKRRIDCIRGRD